MLNNVSTFHGFHFNEHWSQAQQLIKFEHKPYIKCYQHNERISSVIKMLDFGTTLMTDKGEVQSTEENDEKRRDGAAAAIGFEDLARKTGKY